jgi:lysophospholipase L1-like esterase
VSGSGRSRAAIAALAIVSGLASLGALELLVRLTGLGVHAYMHEVQMYGLMLVPDEEGRYLRHPAGASVVLQGVTLRFNSLGMRDDEPRIPKPPGTFRVLCLGDSVTLGPAVPQEQIYPARLRGLLGPGVDVVAAAVAGWNTVAEERFLARHIETLQPDLVVLLYVTNDNEPTEPFRRLRRPATRWSTRLYRALVTRSRLFEWAAFVAARAHMTEPDADGIRRFAAWKRKLAQAGEPFTERDRGWLQSRAALGRMRSLCREHGARFVIFMQNQRNQAGEQRPLARLREFSAATGVPVFDTWSFIAGHAPVSLMNDGFRDPHWNAEGHALYAAGIARTLRAEGLVPSRAARPAAAGASP